MELEKVRQWVLGYPGMELLQKVWVDYYPAQPGNGSIAPGGATELDRRADILGNVTVECRYDFGLWFVMTRAEGDDLGAAENAQWVLGFQDWVREQSVRGEVPRFGEAQVVRAQDGRLEEVDVEGTAVYLVRLSFEFKKDYEVS